jgi:hypothetical protein
MKLYKLQDATHLEERLRWDINQLIPKMNSYLRDFTAQGEKVNIYDVMGNKEFLDKKMNEMQTYLVGKLEKELKNIRGGGVIIRLAKETKDSKDLK